jgi:hypothetical protein
LLPENRTIRHEHPRWRGGVSKGNRWREQAGDTVSGAVKGGFGGNDNNFLFPPGESTYNVYLISDNFGYTPKFTCADRSAPGYESLLISQE